MLANPRLALLMISNFGIADGGRETWVYNFIPRLLERWPSARVDVVGLNRSGEPDNSAQVREIDPRRVSATFIHSARRRFAALSLLRMAPTSLTSERIPRPDLAIGVGSWVELLVILLSPAFRQVPRIVWLRTIWSHEKARRVPSALRGFAKALELAILRRANVLIANGEDTADYYRKLGLDVVTIANGVDLSRWVVGPLFRSTRLRIAFIGRLIAEKGVRDFLEVGQRLGRSGRFEFHVVGEGPCEPDVLAGQAEGWLIHHGPISNRDLPTLVGEFDVCVALSYASETGGGGGVSNALLEQMAAARVVIAWENATYRQLLDEDNAFMVPQGDLVALERALLAVSAERPEALRRAQAARKTAAAFSFETHIEKFVAVAATLLRGPQ